MQSYGIRFVTSGVHGTFDMLKLYDVTPLLAIAARPSVAKHSFVRASCE